MKERNLRLIKASAPIDPLILLLLKLQWTLITFLAQHNSLSFTRYSYSVAPTRDRTGGGNYYGHVRHDESFSVVEPPVQRIYSDALANLVPSSWNNYTGYPRSFPGSFRSLSPGSDRIRNLALQMYGNLVIT